MRMQISIIGNSNRRSVKERLHHCCEEIEHGYSGFTLMELIIVCSLVGLLLSFALPSMKNNLLTNPLDSTARKLIGTVKELRNTALREHKAYLLHFDITGNTIWYEEDGRLNPFNDEPENLTKLPDDVRLEGVHMRNSEKTSVGEATLWISKKGYMDETAVYLANGEGSEMTLLFSPFSGAATIYDRHVDIEEE